MSTGGAGRFLVVVVIVVVVVVVVGLESDCEESFCIWEFIFCGDWCICKAIFGVVRNVLLLEAVVGPVARMLYNAS
jgi:hypothetical protein